MIENLPIYISIVFILTTVLSLLLFYWAVKNATTAYIKRSADKIAIFLLAWIGIQGILGVLGVYASDLEFIPPKIFLMGVFPTIIMIVTTFFTKKGNEFIDGLALEKLTYLNLVRIPVELVLLFLFLNSFIPKIMTFEGWNFDIIMGLTAPVIIYFGFVKKKLNLKVILAWNVIGVILLLFIVLIALFSSPFPLQQFAFDQPNIAILYFPFVWLPTFVVPIVMFGHFVSIKRILRDINNPN